jgi:hypothetical protein
VKLEGSDRKEFGPADSAHRAVLRNKGAIDWADNGELWLTGNKSGGPLIENAGALKLRGSGRLVASTCCVNPSRLTNSGTVERRGSGPTFVLSGVFIDNSGTVQIAEGQ